MARVHGIKQLEHRLELVGDVRNGIGPDILKRWQIRTVELAKIAAPKRSTHLKHSIHAGARTPMSAKVEASAPYAAYMEYGTRPHDIRPVHAKVLAWGGPRRLSGALRAGGKATNFAMLVHHPGTRPRPFLGVSARKAQGEAGVGTIVEAWNRGA